MKRLLWLLLLVSISYAQFFEGTNSDIPVPVESKNPAFHVSTFGGFKLVDSYYTRDQYDEILPPYGFALGFSTKRIFVNLGYAKNRDFEITFHHMFFKQGVLTALWGVNGLLVPDIESEATSYVPEDSTSKFFRIPLFAEVYLKPHKWFSGGIGFGFGKFGVRNRFEDPLQTPGIFATAAFTPIKQLKIFWEGYTQTYRRNWGVVISPNDYLEVFGILRYGQYPPGDDIKFNQLLIPHDSQDFQYALFCKNCGLGLPFLFVRDVLQPGSGVEKGGVAVPEVQAQGVQNKGEDSCHPVRPDQGRAVKIGAALLYRYGFLAGISHPLKPVHGVLSVVFPAPLVLFPEVGLDDFGQEIYALLGCLIIVAPQEGSLLEDVCTGLFGSRR